MSNPPIIGSPDITRASLSLQTLKLKPKALEDFDVALTKLRHELGHDVNDATFNYVVNALVNQRPTDGSDPFGTDSDAKLPGGFRILPSAASAKEIGAKL